jgi:hypothetical protein
MIDTAKLLQELKDEVRRLQRVITVLESDESTRAPRRGKRNLSAKARAAISRAQKKRWARVQAKKSA